MHIVILGSGIAGITLAETLKKLQPDWPVSVITQESHGYYSRPMLSHGFSRDDVESRIILKSFDALRDSGINVEAHTKVVAVHPERRTLTLQTGAATDTRSYDRLVLAVGSEAFIPPPLRHTSGGVRVVNSLDDLICLRRTRQRIQEQGRPPRWAMIGGGLIGCEVAADLARAGDSVVLFHAGSRLMERQLSEADSLKLHATLEGQGITVHRSVNVEGISTVDDRFALHLATGIETGFDQVIVACGFSPRTELAAQAGLSTGRGIQVDDYLTTSHPDIHALGDAAECSDGRLYAYVLPVRHQAVWLANYLAGTTTTPWAAPAFKPRAKVHGFEASSA